MRKKYLLLIPVFFLFLFAFWGYINFFMEEEEVVILPDEVHTNTETGISFSYLPDWKVFEDPEQELTLITNMDKIKSAAGLAELERGDLSKGIVMIFHGDQTSKQGQQTEKLEEFTTHERILLTMVTAYNGMVNQSQFAPIELDEWTGITFREIVPLLTSQVRGEFIVVSPEDETERYTTVIALDGSHKDSDGIRKVIDSIQFTK